MTDKIFATAINCIDGRVQIPVIEWLRRHYGVDYVDMITEPGPERLLAEGKDITAIESMRKKVETSTTRHNSILVAVVGHYDCAGNPVPKETQIGQILTVVTTLNSWNFVAQAIGLWIDEYNEVREVTPPCGTG